MKTDNTNWWGTLYDDLLEDMLLERESAAETDKTLDFIIRHLDASPGARIFDQCCGNGSLALPLAERGYQVHGVDQAAAYIEKAKAGAKKARGDTSFVAADAFDYSPEPCAGAFNWWTSFGYADDDQTNMRMLERAYEALAPGST